MYSERFGELQSNHVLCFQTEIQHMGFIGYILALESGQVESLKQSDRSVAFDFKRNGSAQTIEWTLAS